MHFSDCLPILFLAISSVGSWGTPTFLTFPDLSIPWRLTRFNLVTGTIFWYFWHVIIRPQLTVSVIACALFFNQKKFFAAIIHKSYWRYLLFDAATLSLSYKNSFIKAYDMKFFTQCQVLSKMTLPIMHNNLNAII